MRVLLSLSLVAALVGTPETGAFVRAGSPFDGTRWTSVIEHDPSIQPDPNVRGLYYTSADKCGGQLPDQADVLTGRLGGRVVAAVPMPSGGTIGINCWLLYRPNEAKHFAAISGSDGVAFKNDRIVGTNFVGDHLSGKLRIVVYEADGDGVKKTSDRIVAGTP